MPIQSQCPCCGAPIPPSKNPIQVEVRCLYCGSLIQDPVAAGNPASIPGILTCADFNDPNLTGWERINPDKQYLVSGDHPELIAEFPPSKRLHFVLKTSGYFEDQDIRVKVRFLEGEEKALHAGFCARFQDGKGGYCILISYQRDYIIGYYTETETQDLLWNTLADWRLHSALKTGFGEANEIRMVLKGTKISVFLNDVLTASIHDETFKFGQTHLAVEPGETMAAKVAFSDYIVYEA